ncbi:hypothetical protein D3C87_1766020 [compost metagenome]
MAPFKEGDGLAVIACVEVAEPLDVIEVGVVGIPTDRFVEDGMRLLEALQAPVEIPETEV